MGPAEAQALDEHQKRKGEPVYSGFIKYFPRAMKAVARLSLLANERHNPGESLHWSKHKSSDHRDCIARHLIDAGTWDTTGYSEPVLHSTELAWRAMANLEIELENLDVRNRNGGDTLHEAQRGSREDHIGAPVVQLGCGQSIGD